MAAQGRPPVAEPRRSRRVEPRSALRAPRRVSELTVWPVTSALEILVHLPALPIDAEEPAHPQEHDRRNGHADACAEHRPVEPERAAVIEQVDGEPHQTEDDPDPHNRIEDPPAANVAPSSLPGFLPGRVHGLRILRCRELVSPANRLQAFAPE